jgi:hypothetical protein
LIAASTRYIDNFVLAQTLTLGGVSHTALRVGLPITNALAGSCPEILVMFSKSAPVTQLNKNSKSNPTYYIVLW